MQRNHSTPPYQALRLKVGSSSDASSEMALTSASGTVAGGSLPVLFSGEPDSGELPGKLIEARLGAQRTPYPIDHVAPKVRYWG